MPVRMSSKRLKRVAMSMKAAEATQASCASPTQSLKIACPPNSRPSRPGPVSFAIHPYGAILLHGLVFYFPDHSNGGGIVRKLSFPVGETMLFFNKLRDPVFMTVLSILLVGCVAHHADEFGRQKQERASKHENGNINRVSHSQLARINPPPTDLRTPNDKSLRQFYLIIKYGISATGMIPIQEAAKLNDEEILRVISYLSHLQGHSPSFDLISSHSFLPHTDTDVAISLMYGQEALADVDKEERCEDRYAKRYPHP